MWGLKGREGAVVLLLLPLQGSSSSGKLARLWQGSSESSCRSL